MDDVDGPDYYVWYPTLGQNQRPADELGPYIREDTIKLPDKQVPGKGDRFTAKTDVNAVRIAAETLISTYYSVPMSRTSLGAVFLDDEGAYKAYAKKVAIAQILGRKEELDESSKDFAQLVDEIAGTNALTELGEVHINRAKVGSDGLGTVIHELMHFYGDQSTFIASVCGGNSGGFNEGVTEYFAQKVTKSVGISRSKIYATEVRQATEIIGLVGEGLLIKAYFLGDTAPLINALKHHGRWDNTKNQVLPKAE